MLKYLILKYKLSINLILKYLAAGQGIVSSHTCLRFASLRRVVRNPNLWAKASFFQRGWEAVTYLIPCGLGWNSDGCGRCSLVLKYLILKYKLLINLILKYLADP